MKPAAFTYHRVATLDEAVALMARFGTEAKPISGGQSLTPMMNMRIARPAHLVDLNDLLELDFIRVADGVVEIGAMTRHARVASAPEVVRELPLLAEAANTIGHYAIRQRGTLGGSLVHADPAAQLPLIAVTLGAEIVLKSVRGLRIVAAQDFFLSIMTVDIAEDEILTSVRFPAMGRSTGWAFDLVSRRRGDFAMASVALALDMDDAGRVSSLRFGIGGVSPVPARLEVVEQAAFGHQLQAGMIAALAAQASAEIDPEDTPQLPATYLRELVDLLSRRSLKKATETLGETV
ncbi:MAG: xanthine dehydrogenase family protein subunit M [Rhodobacteraceae bacterium]|nr:xanthine dehydrogenase family protein subunit M [Paracoccaceae bacterium]